MGRAQHRHRARDQAVALPRSRRSVVEFIDELDRAHENDIVTVILPEFVLTRWWQQLLHNQSALMLKARLLFRRNTVVVSVPYHIEHGKAEVLGDPQ